MQLASKTLSADDRQKICQTVAQAESITSAEIVPVVATSSGRYDRAEDMVGLWFAAAALAAAWFIWPRVEAEHGSWGGIPKWIDLVVLLVSMIVGFVVGAFIASRVGWLRRLFTHRAMLAEEVESRARRVFFDARVHHTDTRGGLLIYISLFEHQAVVVADSAVNERISQAQLDGLCQRLTGHLRDGSLTKALCETITAAGELLAKPLPRQANDVNELPDALVILDQPL
jgi:putative membrane protein